VTGAVITDVGQPVYATDDNAFSFVPTSGMFIGFVRRWVSSGYAIVEFDAGVLKDPHEGYVPQTVTTDLTIDNQDSSKVLCVTTDSLILTLPAVQGICNIRYLNCGAFGTVAVTISPNVNDMIEGPDLNPADNKDYVNTKTTARRGDYVDIDYSDNNGWVITGKRGIWEREA